MEYGVNELVLMPLMFEIALLPDPQATPPFVDLLNPIACSVYGDVPMLIAKMV